MFNRLSWNLYLEEYKQLLKFVSTEWWIITKASDNTSLHIVFKILLRDERKVNQYLKKSENKQNTSVIHSLPWWWPPTLSLYEQPVKSQRAIHSLLLNRKPISRCSKIRCSDCPCVYWSNIIYRYHCPYVIKSLRKYKTNQYLECNM